MSFLWGFSIFGMSVISCLSLLVSKMFMFWALAEMQLFFAICGLMKMSVKLAQVYFCANFVGGMAILMGGVKSVTNSGVVGSCSFLCLVGMIVKLGGLPLPSWVPYMMSNLSRIWFFQGSSMVLVLSKMLPLVGLVYFFSSCSIVFVSFLLLQLWFCVIGMFGSQKIGELLGWSSVGGLPMWWMMGWGDPTMLLFSWVLYSFAMLVGVYSSSYVVLFFFLLGMPPLSFFLFKGYFFYVLSLMAGSFSNFLVFYVMLFISGLVGQVLMYANFIVMIGINRT